MLLVCQFLSERGYQYSYYVNDNRKHGFMLDADKLSGYFVIAVDFSISYSKMQELVDHDVAVLCMDHHNIQDEFIHIKSSVNDTEGIVFNNQYCFEPEEDKYQSGAGVVYECLSACYPEFQSKEREALVGITLLSDIRPIENEKARKYLKTLFTADTSDGYIGYLLQSVLDTDYNFGLPRMDRNFVDYTFSPRVNALLRFGRKNEAIDFILGKGLSGSNPKPLQSQLLNDMKMRSSVLDLENITILGIDANDFEDYHVDITSFIGLLCSDVKGTGKSTLGFVYDNGVVTRASFRGRYDDIGYLSGFKSLGIEADGHSGAFGITTFNPTRDTWDRIDKMIGDLDSHHKTTVTIHEVTNLSLFLNQKGEKIAENNCYVRDMYRTYIKYKGSNAQEIKHTYRTEEFSPDDYALGVQADFEYKGVKYKYLRDKDGNKITKYIEYVVDGKKVKSFGVSIYDGLILPVLEKGYIQLYIREMTN